MLIFWVGGEEDRYYRKTIVRHPKFLLEYWHQGLETVSINIEKIGDLFRLM